MLILGNLSHGLPPCLLFREIDSYVESEANGNGGDIQIQTSSLLLTGEHQLSTQTQGQGNAGDITIVADIVTASGRNTSINSRASREERIPGTSGNGGDIEITANRLLLDQGTQVVASTDIDGQAGNIQITTSQATIQEAAQVLAESTFGRDGGNIVFTSDLALQLQGNSLISTTAGDNQNPGNGGNIAINTPFLIGLPDANSDIIANAFEGSGGNITINAEAILNFELQNESNIARLRNNKTNDISASSELGNSGVLDLTGLNIDPSQGANPLPITPTPNNQVDRTCAAQTTSRNHFTVTGRGGLPLSPHEPPATSNSTASWVPMPKRATLSDSTATSTSSSSPAAPIEASGWQQGSTGQIFLVAPALQLAIAITPDNCPS